jgi:hypothetical protein
MDGLGNHHRGGTGSSWPLDSGPDERDLEASDRGGGARGCVLAELEPNHSGAPAWVFALELAGELEQLLGSSGDWATTRAIVGSEVLATRLAGQPPDVPDRAVRDRQVNRDLGQGDALLMTTHDLLTKRDREGARHGSRLQRSEERDQLLINANVIHADEGSPNLPAPQTVQTLQRLTGKPDLLSCRLVVRLLSSRSRRDKRVLPFCEKVPVLILRQT